MNIATIKVNQICACTTERKPVTSGMAGVTVKFEYDDPLWDGLNKTAVFTAGSVTRDVLNADSVVTVPAEVLKKPGLTLTVGVYGTDADGKLIIPTVMTPIGLIMPGADPSGDPGTDPDLPIWAQLQADVEELKKNGGGGSGTPGEDGGYYTPSITKPTDTTMEVAFTPSEASMPAVGPFQVTLPVPDSTQNVELDTTLTVEGKAADAKAVGDKVTELENKIPNSSHYSMTTIASGTYTPTSDDETATTVGVDLSIEEATLEKIRGYKAVFVQFSANSPVNTNGSVTLNMVDSARRYEFCGFRYKLQSYRAVILFTDAEHYAAIVFIQSSSDNLSSKMLAQTGATSLASVGIADFSTVDDAGRLLFKIGNAAVGNEISYQVIGIAEEAANFT